MKHTLLKQLVLLLCLALAACNFPGIELGDPATPTPTATPVTPTATQAPPPTDTPVPPSPTPEPPTATIPPVALPPSQAPVNLTTPPTPVPALTPYPRSKYEGQFDGGKITLRVNDKGNMIALKVINLRNAQCGDQKVSDTIAYDGVLFFPIDKARFGINMTLGSRSVAINGYFPNPNVTSGTLKVTYLEGNKTCSVGPVKWVATLSE